MPSPVSMAPLAHNVVLTVNNNAKMTLLPPIVAAIYAHVLGVRPYVLIYEDVEEVMAAPMARCVCGAGEGGVGAS